MNHSTGWHRLGIIMGSLAAVFMAIPVCLALFGFGISAPRTSAEILATAPMLLVPLVGGILVYALMRGIGWVAAGFSRSAAAART